MNDKYEIRKRLTIILWVFITGLLFWIASFLPNTFDEGSFLAYVIMLFGGGFVYHFLTEMIAAPANQHNWNQWAQLAVQLISATFCVLGVFAIFYFEKHCFSLGGLPTFIAIFSAIWLVIGRAEKAHKILYEIKDS